MRALCQPVILIKSTHKLYKKNNFKNTYVRLFATELYFMDKHYVCIKLYCSKDLLLIPSMYYVLPLHESYNIQGGVFFWYGTKDWTYFFLFCYVKRGKFVYFKSWILDFGLVWCNEHAGCMCNRRYRNPNFIVKKLIFLLIEYKCSKPF